MYDGTGSGVSVRYFLIYFSKTQIFCTIQYLIYLAPTKFFFLHAVARNVDCSTLRDLLQALAEETKPGN